jgi:hypothetical protein
VQKGIVAMDNIFALIVLGFALVVGAAITVEVMLLSPELTTACVNANC